MSRPLNPWKLSGYKAGQNVVCKITQAEPGGYAVIISKDNLPGFLPTRAQLRTGQEVLAQFVCVDNNRILLSVRFGGDYFSGSSDPAKAPPTGQVRWEDHLSNSGQIPAVEISQPQTAEAKQEPDAAFRVWASHTSHQLPRFVHLKRAIDLILPPLHTEPIKKFQIKDYDLEWLITDLEGGMRTCCLKISNNDVLSRSAILLYRGRAVGCAYSTKENPEPPPTEEALQRVLKDLNLPNTSVAIYDLPESLTVASSALFMGYPVGREDDYDARAYTDYICEWSEGKNATACLAFSLPNNRHCFGYIYRGQFVGSFYVEEQLFTQDKNYLYKLLEKDQDAQLDVTILPPEMTSSAVRFGFSLSMARKEMNR